MVQNMNQPYPGYLQQPVYQQPMYPQPMRTNALNGKYVNSETDIYPNEISMDGSKSYFPTVDENIIYVKYWDANGRIVTKKYSLDVPANPVETPDPIGIMNARFDALEKLILSKVENTKGMVNE